MLFLLSSALPMCMEEKGEEEEEERKGKEKKG